MRIAYLINQYPMVSHSFIRREILALERAGVEVVRIAIRGWEGTEPLDEQDRSERKNTHYVLRNGGRALLWAVLRILVTCPVRLCNAIALAWKMGRRAERPLPVHFIYLAEACYIALELRKSAVQHLHAHFGTNPAEVAMLVHVLGGPSYSFTVHGPEEFDKPRFIGLAEKIRRSAFVVAISSYGRSQLFRCVEQEQWSKVKVVHCGLEQSYMRLDSQRSLPPTQRLVCVGRLCEQKGQLLLLDATQQLAQRGIWFELVLAGDGEMRREIEDLVKQYELEATVRITGWITGSQVREELLAARALVLPSFAEGLPVVIMEAMALNRPIISTYVAGIPELVRHKLHGWLVPAGDVRALADAMQECLERNAEELTAMGSAAHERVVERHNVDVEAAKLANLFGTTIGFPSCPIRM